MRRESELAAGPRRGPAVGLRHRLRPGPRRPAAGVRGGARARGAGAARAAPDVRPAGRRVHVHAAAVPGAAMSAPRRRAPGHRCTTRHAQAIYPFMAAGGLGGRGVFIGRDAGGGAFCYDPWVLYGEGALDDPNVIVLGKLGQGKSALVKTLLWRMLLFGRRAFVLDVKREYGPLCDAVGVEPISLVPGGGVRLNPLASRPEEHAQLELLRAVAVTAIGGPADADRGRRRCARRCARSAHAASASRRCPRSPAALFAPVGRDGARLRTTAERARRRRAARRAGAPGPVRGPAAGDVRRPDDAGARPRRPAARARPARRPRLAGGRDPDGVRDRLDERAAGADGRAARARAADQRRRRVVEDRPAHRPRRVVSVELQARAPVRRDEPRRAAQARRPAGGRRRRARAPRGSPRG